MLNFIASLQITDIVLLLFALVCSYTDLKERKVYNLAVISALILGFGLNFTLSGVEGVLGSLLGALSGFMLLIVFYLLGGIGAGDVKYLMAVGSLKHSSFLFVSFFYGAVLAALAAVIILKMHGRLLSTLKEIGTGLYVFFTSKTRESLKFGDEKSPKLPYSVFLSLGVIARYIEILIKG